MAPLTYTCRAGYVTIQVVSGDITEFEGDAIVNPANTLMIMGGGVALAIKRRGGAEIEEKARRHAPVPIGGAVATGAGRLRVRYVIHAVCP
ncbi:Appr-1-p processing domain protein [Thermogladius calderae 1633]|uniref:Appr-1-p processing domain protein n=1 Tax=Thermogladius calderae (strain DSM 22663 / VKM B-2946 / 1633) TaxID=1184251 RepID=I3TFS1_THEC1